MYFDSSHIISQSKKIMVTMGIKMKYNVCQVSSAANNFAIGSATVEIIRTKMKTFKRMIIIINRITLVLLPMFQS